MLENVGSRFGEGPATLDSFSSQAVRATVATNRASTNDNLVSIILLRERSEHTASDVPSRKRKFLIEDRTTRAPRLTADVRRRYLPRKNGHWSSASIDVLQPGRRRSRQL